MAKVNILIGGLQLWLASSTQFQQSLRRLQFVFAIQSFDFFPTEFFTRLLFEYSDPLTPVEELQLDCFTQKPFLVLQLLPGPQSVSILLKSLTLERIHYILLLFNLLSFLNSRRDLPLRLRAYCLLQ